MPVEVLNVTLQGTGMISFKCYTSRYSSWQLFIQPPEGADIITKGIHINIYFTIYVYVNLYHTHFQIVFYLALEKAVCVDIELQPPSAI